MKAIGQDGRDIMAETTARAAGGAGRGPAGRLRLPALAALAAPLVLALPLSLPLAVTAPAQVQAQNLFAPRLYVNGRVITEYEVRQRALFLQLLRQPGDPERIALDALRDERIQQTEAARLDLSVTDEEVLAGMAEFAARASLGTDEFVAELAKEGIAKETFRDFVVAGLLWRGVVHARFTGLVSVSDAEVDRALEVLSRPRSLKVLVSELVIPMEPGKEDSALALASSLSQSIHSEGEFAAAARRYSAAPTAEAGGRVPQWLQLDTLPGVIAQAMVALGPGDVSVPVTVPEAVVLFQLRDIARDEKAPPITVTLDWAEYRVADTGEAMARIAAGADGCNDLYKLARNDPPEALAMHSARAAEVPGDVGLVLARLDPGEVAPLPGGQRLVMLCRRNAELDPAPSRDQIRNQLLNQRIESLAEGYLQELRSAALIREP